MSFTIRQIGVLVLLFLVCFFGAYLIRNGQSLVEKGTNSSGVKGGGFQPQKYDLQDELLVDLDTIQVLQRLDAERTTMIQSIIPSVVCISTEGVQRKVFSGNAGGGEKITAVRDVGSGVVVSKQGHVVTNHHVIAGKERFVVALWDGSEYNARLIGSDPTLDIAVLKLEATGVDFQPLPFGNSEEVAVGQMVFAVGNPFGLGETVTQGIISAKERTFSDHQRDLFQTDAAINPGNSGGPLVNVRGEIIGINVAIFSTDKDEPSSQGVGFSIPSNEVLRTFQQIAERGRPIRGYLGVKLMDLTPELRAYLNYQGKGVVITEVIKGAPAEEAGLLPRDVIVSYNGENLQSFRHLIGLIQNSPLDREVDVEILRDGERIKKLVRVIDSIEWSGSFESITDTGYRELVKRVASIGLEVRSLEWIEKRRGAEVGVVVSAIRRSSLASKTGLRKGDRVISMNGEILKTPEQFYRYLIEAKKGEELKMVVQRNTQRVQINFSLR